MELKFGIRMSSKNGISIYGIDEVNAALEAGASVRELKGEGATFIKSGQNESTVSLVFSGGDFSLIMDAPIENSTG